MDIQIKNIVLYLGYSPQFNGDDWKGKLDIGGSEIAAVNLLIAFKKLNPDVNIHVFGFSQKRHTDTYGIEWYDMGHAYTYMSTAEVIDVFIISRYINAFIHLPHITTKCKKIFIWVHDVCLHNSFQGKTFPEHGKGYITNFASKIDGLICMSEWHRDVLAGLYPALSNKLIIIPNGCDNDILDIIRNTPTMTKKRFRFVWGSHHSRNIENLIAIWPFILEKLPTATLVIMGEETPKTKLVVDMFVKHNASSVTNLGKVDHMTLFKELMMADVWFYPTFFQETYCILALEAQLAQCLCVAYDEGSLKTTIGDRGIIFSFKNLAKQPSYESIAFTLVKAIALKEGEEERIQMRKQASAWALQQTWDSRAESWAKLF